MNKKSEAHLHNVVILVLGIAILLMSLGTRDLMGDANVAKKELSLSYSPPQSD
jgi:membrane protein required for beta-lactamase induction